MADKEILRPGPQSNFPDITFSGFRFFQDVAKWINNAIARLVVLETVQAWQTPTLLNGWVDYGAPLSPAGYYKDPWGRVHLRGVVKNGTAVANTPIFLLPAGYRPEYQVLVGVESSGAHGRTDVKTDGNVVFQTGANTLHQLDNISFRAA